MNNASYQKYYLKAIENFRPFGDRVQLIRGYSANVVHQFVNNSIDLVYIDARHDYCSTLEDLEAYWPKLKIGGVMSGHGKYFSVLIDRTLYYFTIFQII
jgi:predicted O-methyltransferase YrrM